MTSPTRARILSVASRLYLQAGGDGLSMRKVADRIGVSATAIYRHFPNRAALVEAVVEDSFDVFEEFLTDVPPLRKGRAWLRRFMRQYLEFAIQKPRRYEVLFLLRRQNLRRYPEEFSHRRSRTFEVLHEVVRAEVRAGSFRGDRDSREMALALWVHAHGFAAQYWVGRFGTDLNRVRAMFDRYMDHLIDGLKP